MINNEDVYGVSDGAFERYGYKTRTVKRKEELVSGYALKVVGDISFRRCYD
jgi:hypothetical protein